MKGLTPKQREVLQFIHDYRQSHPNPPSYREIMEHFGFGSVRAAKNYAEILARKGMLQLGLVQAARAYALTPSGLAELGVTIAQLPAGVTYYRYDKLDEENFAWRKIRV